MKTDYKQLCLECFGTTEPEELKKIAERLHTTNPRHAGRKPKLTTDDEEQILKMLAAGKNMEEIALHFGTTRQNVSKRLNKRPEPGYTMRMTLMYQQNPCTVIDVDFATRKIAVQNRTNDMLHRAFGINETPTWKDFEHFLLERCFPASRGNAKELLNLLKVPGYDPLAIVEKTKGRMAEDHLWLKFAYYDKNGKMQKGARDAGN